MEEIVEEEEVNVSKGGVLMHNSININNNNNTVEIILRTIGPARPSRLRVPSPIKTPHNAIRDHTPNHQKLMPAEFAHPASKKLLNTAGHNPMNLENSSRVVGYDVFTIWGSLGHVQGVVELIVCHLRKLIAENDHLPIENLRLILRGNVLHDRQNGDDVSLQLNSGDSLIVAVKPKPPVKHVRDGFDDDDEEEDLKFQLPQSSSRWKRRLYSFLHNKLKLPDILLMAIFTLSLKMWVVIILWFILAPVAHRWDLGPLYILGTGFGIIILNLGQRQPGDVSAYSVFNEDFRELPGTLNADRLDRDIRAGQF
uniref:Ubiquitin-like domain-containing protein n=1 Tax=Quercus lobata TaxID=97700 RepID=A0A7N2N235_QUELO